MPGGESSSWPTSSTSPPASTVSIAQVSGLQRLDPRRKVVALDQAIHPGELVRRSAPGQLQRQLGIVGRDAGEGVQQHVPMSLRRPGPVSWAVDYAVYFEAAAFAVPDWPPERFEYRYFKAPGTRCRRGCERGMTHGAGT